MSVGASGDVTRLVGRGASAVAGGALATVLRLLMLTAVFGSCIANAEETVNRDWSRTTVVRTPNAEGRLLQAAFSHAKSNNVGLPLAVQALGDLNRYIDGRTEKGMSATVSVGLVVDILVAADRAHWSPEDASRAVLQVQRSLDRSSPPSHQQLERIVAGIRAGRAPGEVLETGEAP